ncbi:hypothetical protein EVAR_74145_1 [Eumeta japonica]|uniref:Uncharacterized protein n=1 Tax=Eumeta variegata TaxID=151549 RepID=A0A4C1SZD8_EUMVA|nr:hypothetical protein EVAR_74145_1 [Eumeta japonica]
MTFSTYIYNQTVHMRRENSAMQSARGHYSPRLQADLECSTNTGRRASVCAGPPLFANLLTFGARRARLPPPPRARRRL